MSDDIVKRLVVKLRYLGDHAAFEPHMFHDAADRIEAQAKRIAELEALLKRADDIANWTGEDLIYAGRSYASVVQAYKNDRAAAKEGKP